MKLYITLNKKSLGIILALTIISIIILGQISSAAASKPDGSTFALRKAYLSRIGYEIDPKDNSTKEIIIPQEFSSVYNEYNSLQKQAGFNLEKYKGAKATLYTYKLVNNDLQELHLIVYNGQIIGGDVASIKLDGEMKPLKKENTE